MNILKNVFSKELDIIKKIFCSGDIFSNITLFSFIGIFSIAGLNVSSFFKGYGYSNLSYFFPVKESEFVFDLLIFICLGIILSGFLFKMVNANFSNNFKMPEIDLDCVNIFFKIFPLQVVWFLYYLVFDYIFHKIIGAWSLIFLLGLFPFVNLIWVMFARNFIMNNNYINPKFVFSIISGTLIDVFRLSFFTFLIFLTAGIVSLLFFINSEKLQSQIAILSVRLVGICVGCYLLFITQYFFNIGLSEIVKEKFSLSENETV